MTLTADASVSCYVCGGVADANPQLDLRSPRCASCEPAAGHIISMQTDRIVCGCGWERELSYLQPAEREAACKTHWRDVIQEYVPTTERHLPSEEAATSTASEQTSDNFKRQIVTDTKPDPLVAEPVIMLDPSEIDADMPGRIGLFYPVKADGLAARIEADGQLEPILVTRTGPRAAKRFRLVAGLHRLRACEKLGRNVDARIVTGSPEELLRMQASENLDRRQMSVLERSMFIAAVAKAAMLRVVEAHGGASQQQVAIKARWNTVDKLSTVSAPSRGGDDVAAADEEAEGAVRGLDAIYSWKAETAEACGLGEKDVQRAMRIYRCVVEPFRDLMDQLKDHPAADNATKLLGVAGVVMSARRQAILDLMAEPAAEKPPVDRAQKRFNTLIDTYQRMPAIERRGAIQGIVSQMTDAELELAKLFIEEKLK